MASALTLSLLLSTTLADGVEKLNGHQVLEPKRWYKPGSCFNLTESCLGTVSWCSQAVYYAQDGYDSQDSCFRARVAKTEWRYMNTDCLAVFEACDGTDMVCSRVANPAYRGLCYDAHIHARYLEPFSEGCLGAKKHDDERCVGTKAFCEAKERRISYGSTKDCLAYREKPSDSEMKEKRPFLLGNFLFCTGDPTEACEGTEKFCGKFNGQQKQQCIESHHRPPFYGEASPECQTSMEKVLFSEPCVGTEAWCENKARVDLYGSEDACRKFREPPEIMKSPWIPANYTCLENPDGSERCEGTGRFCLSRSASRKACFESRELPGQLRDLDECRDRGAADERCMGVIEWCYGQAVVMNETECPGLVLQQLSDLVSNQLAPATERILGEKGELMVRNSTLRVLVLQQGTPDAAKDAIRDDLDKYFYRIDEAVHVGTIAREAWSQLMTELRSGDSGWNTVGDS